MSADAFAAFEEAGLDNEVKVKETGRRFRNTVLSLGGKIIISISSARSKGRSMISRCP